MNPTSNISSTRREFLLRSGKAMGSLALWWAGFLPTPVHSQISKDAIPIGVLHSLTGTMGSSGRTLVDSIRLAVDEINQQGGVLGRPLHPIIEDGASDPQIFREKAENLITQQHVHTIFGCWTSSSRKAVLPIVEKENHLLWYPVQYEGMEQSQAIMYGGAAPNQQILPALQWGIQEFGKKVFLIGSDYIFPRTANHLVKTNLTKLGAQLRGEMYHQLGDQNFDETIKTISQSKPDFIINTLNGSSNQNFFRSISKSGITSVDIPIISMSIAEDEFQHIGLEFTNGHYAAWNYFQSLDSPTNHRFVSTFQQRYGKQRVTDDPMESAYVQVHLYAQAAKKAGSTKPDDIRHAAAGLIFPAPQGLIRVDPENQHTWKVARIGQIQRNGQFKIMWSSEQPIKPEPYIS